MHEIIHQLKTVKERPSWSEYFMAMAYLSSCRSTCGRLHVGCIIVKNNRVLSTGYNGFIAGANHVGCVRDGHEQLTIHAEINAVCHAAKEGIALKGGVAYVTHYCCLNCTKALISAGIEEIVFGENYKNDDLVEPLCCTANVTLTQFLV